MFGVVMADHLVSAASSSSNPDFLIKQILSSIGLPVMKNTFVMDSSDNRELLTDNGALALISQM
jgi:hypothetical protein